MEKDILKELEKELKERHISIPVLSVKLGIPKDRMYKWYQQGTKPKVEDAAKIWDWINGYPNVLAEDESVYKTKYIELLEKTLQEKEERIKELEGKATNPNGESRKKSSG